MATIITAYNVNDTVYHVNDTDGVRKGIVKTTDIKITPTATTVEYSLQFVEAATGSAKVLEPEVYNDIDLALAAYKLLVE